MQYTPLFVIISYFWGIFFFVVGKIKNKIEFGWLGMMEESCCAVTKVTALQANFQWTSSATRYPVWLPKIYTNTCLNSCTRGQHAGASQTMPKTIKRRRGKVMDRSLPKLVYCWIYIYVKLMLHTKSFPPFFFKQRSLAR